MGGIGGGRRGGDRANSLVISRLKKGKVSLKKRDVFTELRNRSLPVSVGFN